MRQVEKQIGKKPLALEAPDFPEQLLYLWEWFIEVSNARGQGVNGPMPISFTEIKAWCDLMSIKLSSWEVGLLKELDNIFIKVVANGRH